MKTLDEDQMDTLRAFIVAVDETANWEAVAENMREAGIDDPEAAHERLRKLAFS